MSKYKLFVHDYHAVKEAEIVLNGITVLSGINGCGKSTLSRWLCYIVNGTAGYDRYLYEDYIKYLSFSVRKMEDIVTDVARSRGILSNEENTRGKLSNIRVNLSIQNIVTDNFFEDTKEMFLQAVNLTADFLRANYTDDLSAPRKERILSFLDNESRNADIEQATEIYINRNIEFIEAFANDVRLNSEQRPISKFKEMLTLKYMSSDTNLLPVQFMEDGVSIFENEHVSKLFNLQRAIYIDTPISLTADTYNDVLWDSLQNMTFHDNKYVQPVEVKKILKEVRDILGGEVILKENDFTRNNSLRFVSRDHKIDIPLKEAATGFKTFSYLQRLLENGYLNSETLLLIDEPEAHLHPQWIVEFARLLVLLYKRLDVKIMIASHNPDMVAAIHDIAEKQGVLGDTNFYVAENDSTDMYKYKYKHLGQEIEEIFKSFNIAIDNINRYGSVDLPE